MIFKSLLPFLCFFCLFGCFEEADDLLDPASEDQGQPEEVLDVDEFSGGGGVPVVSLVVVDDVPILLEREATSRYRFEVDKPLSHRLLVYYVIAYFKVFADGGSETETYKRLAVIEKGEKKSGLFYISLGKAAKETVKSSARILPAQQRSEITLPHLAAFDQKGLDTTLMRVPEGHTFHPYRIGAPFEAVLTREDIGWE